jgi:hypothetical protein
MAAAHLLHAEPACVQHLAQWDTGIHSGDQLGTGVQARHQVGNAVTLLCCDLRANDGLGLGLGLAAGCSTGMHVSSAC